MPPRRPTAISVLVPTYGQARFIRRALEGLLAQSWSDWELVVVNDGSRDDTHEIVRPYLADERITNRRLRANRGLGAERCVEKARQFARIVKLTDPSVELVGCGNFGWTEWDRAVLEGIGSVVDDHSIHLYTGSADYYSNVLAPHQAERALEVCEQFIAKVRYQQNITHPIKIAYDERNVWYRQPSDDNLLEERYTLADTLAVATFLNIYARHCRSVAMANLAQLVNVIAPIVTDRRGHFLRPIYHPL